MRRIAILALTLFVASSMPAFATGLRIGDARLEPASGTSRLVSVSVAWQNGWRNQRNHDAVWLFVKVRLASGAWRHARVSAAGTTVQGSAQPAGVVLVSEDGAGVFVHPAAAHRGAVQWTVSLALTGVEGTVAAVRVFGLEMVQIPSGSFTLGDPDPRAALDFAAVYRSNAAGEPDGLFTIASEGPVDVGGSGGSLYYKAKTPQYEGDRLGPVPAAHPKGFASFYVMKYELTQGMYADFLNTLSGQATYFRAIHGGRGYEEGRGTIRRAGDLYTAGSPERPANWVSWNDSLGFSDWAGLRPMTEFEFTKAARGPGTPIAHEFPWGTGETSRLRRVMKPDDDLEKAGEADEASLTDATRDVVGASFYWVMDLAGSVWERVITFGHPRGRAFTGSHGDGALSGYGDATNEDWPLGDQESGGYGYRGGGYYERGMKPADFNPYSPIAYRRYGSWGGGPRSIAYGYRAVRTAPPAAASR